MRLECPEEHDSRQRAIEVVTLEKLNALAALLEKAHPGVLNAHKRGCCSYIGEQVTLVPDFYVFPVITVHNCETEHATGEGRTKEGAEDLKELIVELVNAAPELIRLSRDTLGGGDA